MRAQHATVSARRRALRVLWAGLLAGTCPASCRRRPGRPVLRIAAASSLAGPFDALEALYRRRTGREAVIVYGSTGLLARQVRQRAPFDVMASADVDVLRALGREGRIAPGAAVHVFGRGRVVVYARMDLSVAVGSLQDLVRPEVRRVAIANPETAPYGRAARQALERAALWEAVRPKLVVADNVRQALQFATSGNADVALTARSALTADAVASGRVAIVSEQAHAPIDHAVAVLAASGDPDAARAFVALLRSPEARMILTRYGLEPPP